MPRPSKLTTEVEEQIISNLLLGCTIEVSCALAGIDDATFYRWQNSKRDFCDKVKRAQAQAHQAAVSAVRVNLRSTQSVVVETETFTETRLRKTKDGDVPYEYSKTTVTRREINNPPDWRAGIEYLKRRDSKNWSDKTTVRIEDVREQAIADIRAGKITYEALAAEDSTLADELFKLAGVPIEN